MHVSFDEDVDAADAVERDLLVFVVAPVAHAGHVDAVGLVLLVACTLVLVKSHKRAGR